VSRKQWIVLTLLGLALAVVCGCLGAMVLLHLTGSLPTQPGSPVEPVDTPTPRPTSTPTTPRVSPLCQAATRDYLAQIQPLLEEWDDAVEVANSTARIALSPMVRDMQGIERDVEDVTVPDCARHGSGLLIDGMGSVIDAFIAFMGEESESVVGLYFSNGYEGMTMGLEQLAALAEGRIPGTQTPAPTRVPPTPTATRVVSVAAPTNTRVIPISTPIPPSPTRAVQTPMPTQMPPGGTMTVDNWEIRVERIETADTVTAPYSDATYKAAGRFALVFMAVTNRALRPDTFVAYGTADVQDAEGRRYEEDPAVSAIAMSIYNTDIPARINPDATVHCVAAFDISKQSSWYRLVPGSLADSYSGNVALSIP